MSLETFTALQRDFNSAFEKSQTGGYSYEPQIIKIGSYSAQQSSDKIIGFHGDILFYWSFDMPESCQFDANILPLTHNEIKNIDEDGKKQFSFSKMLFTKSGWKNPMNDIYLDFSETPHELFNPPTP